MQVPEYARRIFAAGHPDGRLDVAAAIAARMDRQIALYEESRRFEFVIGESALRWRIAPANVMLAQIDRVMAVAGLSTVTLGLLPLTSDDSLPGAPIEALRGNRGREVKRRAQALAF